MVAGAPWGWFLARISGMAPEWSAWALWRRTRPSPPIEGEAAQAAFHKI